MTMDLIYASLYMDEGETASTAIQQVDKLLRGPAEKSKDGVLLMDIVYGSGQKEDALVVATGVSAYVKEHYRARLRGFQIALTDQDGRRPMRDIFISKSMKEDDIDGERIVILYDRGWFDGQ